MTTLLLLRHATRPFASLASFGGDRAEAAGRRWLEARARLDAEAGRVEAALYAAAGPKRDDAPRARLAILAASRAVHNRRAPSDDERAAAPELLDSYLRELAGEAEARAAWERAFDADLAGGRRAIVEAARDPLVSFGLMLAARPLRAKLRMMEAGDPAAWGHGERHVAAKALAYLARFATKTSPNSVFCATAIAEARGDRWVTSGAPAIARSDLILSVAESRKIACTLAADPAIEAVVVPRANPTLRDEDGALSFWRFASVRNEKDDESLSRVKDHPVLRAVLEEARGLPLPELRRRVAERCGLDEAALQPFLRQTIERGILVAEIEIPYNERRPLRHVAERAREAGRDAPWIEPALEVERAVDGLAAVPEADRETAMRRIEASLDALPHARPIARDELYRLDAASALSVAVPEAVVTDLRKGLRPYMRLFSALYPSQRYARGWIDRFLAKFPADRDVEMIDVYKEITEQNDSYRPPTFPEPDNDVSARAMAAVRDHFAAAALRAAPGESIVFDDAVLDRLVPDAADPRWACGILFQIAHRSDPLVVLNAIFHGAGLSLSRFAHLLGGERRDDANPIVRELRRAWSILERPGAIVAEITYNHFARTANAGLRPAIFEHEIELPGDCASPGARVLGLRDLGVRFDTAAGRFVLRRSADGTEVIPVINSGVNPVGFVSFLVAIGEQTLHPIGYFPGFDAPGVTHWPAVVSGRVMLFRERWDLRQGEWPVPPARGDDLRSFARDTLAWRDRFGLPRHVFVHSSKEPKPRYVDLASPVFLDLLRRDLAGLAGDAAATLHVTAMCPGPGEFLPTGSDAGYATEFLVQLSGPE